MKTKEQIKTEVLNYLEQTSKHLFVKKNGELYKVFVEGNNIIVLNGDKTTIYDIDQYISWYEGNAKCVIKHILFLNKELKSTKNFKTMKEKVSTIKEAISEKTDKTEITKITNSIVSGIPVTEEKKSILAKIFRM